MKPNDLQYRITYSGTHKNISYEIVHWGINRGEYTPLNNGNGCWNYYLYISERTWENFSDFWLPSEVCEFSPSGTKYFNIDYYSSPLNVDQWHGGITLWEQKNAELAPQRYIKIGCDYQHLHDQGRYYDVSDLVADVYATIDAIIPLLVPKQIS
jgi:hypothetical protein